MAGVLHLSIFPLRHFSKVQTAIVGSQVVLKPTKLVALVPQVRNIQHQQGQAINLSDFVNINPKCAAHSAPTNSDLAGQLKEEIDRRVEIAEERLFKLMHVMQQPISSDLKFERTVELGRRALFWAYVALSPEDAGAFADAFHSYCDLAYADSMLTSDNSGDVERLVAAHDRSYRHVLECDALLSGPLGQAAIRKAGTEIRHSTFWREMGNAGKR